MGSRTPRLAAETSPYLLSHATNPVDWFPWGDEAFDKAKAEDKPILLSIGYSACHWCHVMEKESFQNSDIAELMNRHFVSIKVDREERPDLDQIYMAATVALNGSGGWPMTVFLTPEGKPFFAGTYFPPSDQGGRLGFPSLLERLAEMWKKERKDLLTQAEQLSDHIRSQNSPRPSGGISEDALRGACQALAKDFDVAFGGFGSAPKFPPVFSLALLLRQYRRTGQQDLLQMVMQSLDMMMSGGLYDQLGGGFCRYSVDRQWLVPHFEKMLYDSALLAELYLEAYQVTGKDDYRRVARETLDYLSREMQSPDGGFFSSSDADSEGGEGLYFTWTREEIEKNVGEPFATHFCEFYGVTLEGNFEERNVLSLRRPLSQVSKELGVPEAELLLSLESSREKLRTARDARPAPAVDDKVLTSWNGLAISALVKGAKLLSEERYLEAAQRAADFLLGKEGESEGSVRRDDGRLFHTTRAGKAHVEGFLEDYAFFSDALVSLYEVSGESEYLAKARELAEIMLRDFSGEEASGPLYSTSQASREVVVRPLEGHDGAVPNANAVAARVLLRLSAHLDRGEWKARAEGIVRSFAEPLKRSPRAFCSLLSSIDLLLEGPLEVVLTGDPESETYGELSQLLGSRFLPHLIEARLIDEPKDPELSPLLSGKFQGDGAAAYVCREGVCQSGAKNAEELEQQIELATREQLEGRKRELRHRRLPGLASSSATAGARAESRLDSAAFSSIAGLTVCRLGLGSYRIGLDHPDHKAAVLEALTSGMNLIDTSPSFAFGDSERVIGECISELCSARKLKRQQLVVITKVGVALGGEAERLETLRKSDRLPDLVVPLASAASSGSSDLSLSSGAFCLDPSFLSSQLEGSLERLGLGAADICLIQSPEHLLAAGRSRAELEEGLRDAFSELEGAVKKGLIGSYGVLSNTLDRDSGDPLFLDLKRLVELASEAGGASHHFRVVEMPINLVEKAAVEDGGAATVARKLDLSVIACRPLSAMVGGALLRFVPQKDSPDGAQAKDLSSARYRVASLEAEFETTFAAKLRMAGQASKEAVLPLSGPLGDALEQVGSPAQFELAETTLVTPRLRQLLGALDQVFSEDGSWQKFRSQYVEAVGAWLATIREAAAEKGHDTLTKIGEKVPDSSAWSEHLGAKAETWLSLPWNERALLPLLHHPSLSATVVGLRSSQQVEAAHQLLQKLKS